MDSIRFCLCGWPSGHFCLFRRETHARDLSTISPTRPEVNERRKVPGKTERVSWQRRAEENSLLEIAVQRRTVGRREQWEDGSRPDKTVKGWVSIHSGFVEVLPKYSLTKPANARRVAQKCLPHSFAWRKPKPLFVRSFFSSTLSVVFCVSVKKCAMPLVGDEKTTH